MKLWCKKFLLYAVGIEPGASQIANSCTNHYTTNINILNDFDTEVFTPGTIPRLNLGQYPG